MVIASMALLSACSCTIPETPGGTLTVFGFTPNVPTPAPAAPVRVVIREYPEKREDGSIWEVTEWSAPPIHTEKLSKAAPAPVKARQVSAKPAAQPCSSINPSPFVGGNWTFKGVNQWSLTGGSQSIHGAPGWVVHTPGYPGGNGLPAEASETTDVATAYNVGGCQ